MECRQGLILIFCQQQWDVYIYSSVEVRLTKSIKACKMGIKDPLEQFQLKQILKLFPSLLYQTNSEDL